MGHQHNELDQHDLSVLMVLRPASKRRDNQKTPTAAGETHPSYFARVILVASESLDATAGEDLSWFSCEERPVSHYCPGNGELQGRNLCFRGRASLVASAGNAFPFNG
jgi:hypothetical protein